MKIRTEYQPIVGDTRIKEGFLFTPKIVDGKIRWLCRAKWQQEYIATLYGYSWVNTCWVEDSSE